MELDARALQRGLVATGQRVRPAGPRTPCEAFVERAKQRVVGQPPRLFALERLELAGARGPTSPFRVDEPPERGVERLVLDAADVLVADRRRLLQLPQTIARAGREVLDAAQRAELRNARHRNVDRIERKCAQRAIWRVLPRRHLVERQELQQVEPAFPEPRGHRGNVGNLPHSPTAG